MPDEPLTNEQVNSILRRLSDNQKEVMSSIASIFNTLASIDPEQYSSAALKVIGYAFQLVALFSPDPESEMKASIAQIAKAVYAGFQALQAADAAIEAKARATFLNGALRDTVDVLRDLKIAIDDPDFFDASDLILKCQASVSLFLHEQLSPIKDNIWNMTRSTAEVEKIYWSDSQRRSACYGYDPYHEKYQPDIGSACYGAQRPPLNDDHTTVFDYRVALPTFLWTVSTLLLVGRTLRTDFVEHMGGYLGEVQAELQRIHDKINDEGLTPLCPPDWTSAGLYALACPRISGGAFGHRRPAIELDHDFVDGRPHAARALIEYGAVEKFSGNSSVAECTVDVDMADAAVFNKLQLRVLKHLKAVYASCGLPEVRAAIGHLRALRGESAVYDRSFLDWSLAEVFRAVKLAEAAPARSLRALEAFLVNTQPLDTPYAQNGPNPSVSFRRLLSDSPA